MLSTMPRPTRRAALEATNLTQAQLEQERQFAVGLDADSTKQDASEKENAVVLELTEGQNEEQEEGEWSPGVFAAYSSLPS